MTKNRMKTKLHNWQLKFDRIFSESVWQQVLVLIGIFVLAQIVGWIVCSQLTFGESTQKISFWEWPLYIFIDGNALNTIYMDDFPNGGRSWVMLFATLGSILGVIVFGGMLISIFSNMLERRIENYRTGRKSYLISNHTVILGYDEIVPSIIKKICESNHQMYILLQSSLPSETIREWIRVSIAQEYEKRIIIKNGHRTSKQDLQELNLYMSSEIFVVGDRTNKNHDIMNIDCIDIIAEVLNESGKGHPETITAVFEDADTYSAMVATDMFKNIREIGIDFVPFNFYVNWAKQLFVDCEYTDHKKDCTGNNLIQKYRPLDDQGISFNDDRHIHLVIIGTSTFGVTLAVEAAKMLHFPNFDGKNNKTEITFIDKNADTERFSFISRYRHFFEVQSYRYNNELIPATKFIGQDADFLDVEYQFIKGDIFSPDIQQQISNWANDSKQILSLVIAMDDSKQNLSISMSLSDELYKLNIPIFIRQNTSGAFINKLKDSRYPNIYPFGMTDIVFDAQRHMQRVAELINIIYEKENINSLDKEVNRGEAHQSWKKCEVAKQWSSLYSAYSIPFRNRSLKASGKYDFENMSEEILEVLAFTEHNRWNVEKLMMGFRKPQSEDDAYNAAPDERNIIKKEKEQDFIHCHIRPYDQLDDNTKEYDRKIVRFIVWALNQHLLPPAA